MSESAAGNDGRDKLPAHWDKMVSAAYLRIMGASQKEAAEGVGRAERTVWGWENDDPALWERARREAQGRWLNNATDAARRAFLKSLDLGNAELAKWLLERVDQALAPPKERLEHSGKVEGAPPLTIVVKRSDGADS